MASQSPGGSEPASRRSTLLISVLAVLFVVVPALFWHGTWFGRSLTDEQIGEYLTARDKPRRAQHALAQISERMSHRDPAVKQWYPRILELADHPMAQLRLTAAWVMGQDAASDAFQRKLVGMLDDAEPFVRRNAALSLAVFGDGSGRRVLRGMLQPYTVRSPESGTLQNRLKVGDVVEHETLLARVAVPGEEEPREVRSPLPGKVKERLLDDGTQIGAGDAVMILDAGRKHVFEALRALYVVGQPEDLPEVERLLRPAGDRSEQVAEQARLTAQQIMHRAGS